MKLMKFSKNLKCILHHNNDAAEKWLKELMANAREAKGTWHIEHRIDSEKLNLGIFQL